MTVTTNEHGQQNLFAKEPTMYTDENYTVTHNEKAEMLNGRLAMLGALAALDRLYEENDAGLKRLADG